MNVASGFFDGLQNVVQSMMLNDLESRGLIKMTVENSEFYIDNRSFIVLDAKGITDLEEYVLSKEEIYADCLGTKLCSDITELIERLWRITQPKIPPKDVFKKSQNNSKDNSKDVKVVE